MLKILPLALFTILTSIAHAQNMCLDIFSFKTPETILPLESLEDGVIELVEVGVTLNKQNRVVTLVENGQQTKAVIYEAPIANFNGGIIGIEVYVFSAREGKQWKETGTAVLIAKSRLNPHPNEIHLALEGHVSDPLNPEARFAQYVGEVDSPGGERWRIDVLLNEEKPEDSQSIWQLTGQATLHSTPITPGIGW